MPIEPTIVTSNSDSLFPAFHNAIEHSPTIPSKTVVRKILVAELDGALRGLIADLFDFEGYCVTEVEDETALFEAMQSVSKATQSPFDLVVLGLQAEGGLDLNTLVRLRDSGCRTPAIVLARERELPVDRRMLELDVAFLSKPFVLENLRIVANHALYTRQNQLDQLD